jgi:hypothetical protein
MLVERGVTAEADANGLLTNVADAARVAPFQTWARDLYVYRQRAFLKDDPMFLHCLPPGGPRQAAGNGGTWAAPASSRAASACSSWKSAIDSAYS